MRDRLLNLLACFQAAHPYRMLVIVFFLTLGFALSASRIKEHLSWSDMLPENHPSTVQFEKVLEKFKSASNMVVVIEGEEQSMKSFADELEPVIKDMKDPVDGKLFAKRVDYKLDMDFIRTHGLKLIKVEDLKNIQDIFKDPNLTGLIRNINNSFEKEYIETDESLSTREKEDSAFGFLDSIEYLIKTLGLSVNGEDVHKEDIKRTADKLLFGDEYMLSYEKDAMLLIVIPNFSMIDMPKTLSFVEKSQKAVDELAAKHGVKAGLTGMIPIQYDETVSINKSLGYTTVIALIAVLVILILSFRMWLAPIFGIITLIIGVIWAVGIATFTVGSLNMMTSIFSVILIGLGVDFGIHIISGFTENRAKGESILDSLVETYRCSGKGIITGALTTSIAFMSIVIARTRGMKEMGIVLGGGVIAVIIVTFMVLPSFLVIRDRRREKKNKSGIDAKDISFVSIGKAGAFLGKNYKKTLAVSTLITLFLGFMALKITYDQNYYNMEAKGLLSVKLEDVIIDKFDLSIDNGIVLASSVEESRSISEELKDKNIVASVEDISAYLPSPEEQRERLKYIRHIKKSISESKISTNLASGDIKVLLKELDRLQMNIMEMQDMAYIGGQDKVDRKCTRITGDPDSKDPKNIIADLISYIENNKASSAERISSFQRIFSPYFKDSVYKMGSEKIIDIADLPDTIADRYANDKRDLFMITVYPKINIWESMENIDMFTNILEEASPQATGMPVIMKYLIDIMGEDGRHALALTVIVVFILLWLDFGRARLAFIAMIPLVIGALWMVGIMKLSGMQFTIMNVMGLPLIIGIGIDDGVHIVHRWQVEGRGRIFRIFASTGKAIMLTSLTTMLAFGSLIFSIYRGFGSLGSAMFIGVGACFMTTIIILSGIIGTIEKPEK